MDVADALTSAAKGAATGMVLGPIGAAAGGVAGLALNLAPELGRWLFGADPAASAATIADVSAAIGTIAGTSDATDAVAALADPAKAMALRVQLAQIAATREAEADAAGTAQLVARLGDVANARATNVAITTSGSRLEWAAVGVDIFVLGLFGGCVLVLMFRALPDAGLGRDLMVGLMGTISTLAVTVVQYHRGSSAGSARKSEQLDRMAPVAA